MLTLEAREDLAQKLEEAFDLELLEAAKVRVRLRVAPHTWEAFRLMALEGLPVAEVAARVRLQVAMVYVAKSKVQKMLQEEIGKLEMGASSPTDGPPSWRPGGPRPSFRKPGLEKRGRSFRPVVPGTRS